MANPYYPPSGSRAGTPSRRPTFDPHLSPRGDVGLSQGARYDDDEEDNYHYVQHGQQRQPPSHHQQPFDSSHSSSSALEPPPSLYPPPSLQDRSPSPAPSDGVHPDRPLKWERLNPEQRRIASTFPEDLDEEGSSMWASIKKMLRNWRTWIKWRYWYYYLALVLIAVMVAFFTIYHRQIIDWLTPISQKVNSVKWGWVIPVAILFVISFPPLFGHEIVAILCGIVYPLWIAFGVVALGTLLGELGNFWAFKWCFRRLAEKYERKSLNYACMAHIVREGGFLVILIARLSAIPGHFTTAVFATVGMNVFIFTLAALLSMPKQLAVVYLGEAIREAGEGGEESTKSKVIKYVVLAISAIITLAAAWYLYDKMEKARPTVQARLRAKRYTMLSEARSGLSVDATQRGGPGRGGNAVVIVDGDDTMRSYKAGDDGCDDEEGTAPYQPSWQQWNHGVVRDQQQAMQRAPSLHYYNGGAGAMGATVEGGQGRGGAAAYYYQQDDPTPTGYSYTRDAPGAASQQDLLAYSPNKEMRMAMLPPSAGPDARDYRPHDDNDDDDDYRRRSALQTQNRPVAADQPPLTPVEPLDMNVLLAATMRAPLNSSAPGQHQQDVSAASYVTASGDAPQAQAPKSNPHAAAAAAAAAAPGGHSQRYRRAVAASDANAGGDEDNGYSLYSYGGHSEVERHAQQQQQQPYGQQPYDDPPRYHF